MTDLSDLVTLDGVLADLTVPHARALFAALGTASAAVLGLDAKAVADRLADRERLGTTGFGGGVALPHAKIDGLMQVHGLFARLTRPIDFGAVDELPVDLVFMLVSPPDAGANHLKALARVSRRLRDRTLAAKLRGAGSRDTLHALLTGIDTRDAA